MNIFQITISILLLGVGAFLVRKKTNISVCPLCFGVSGTWVVLLFMRALGFVVDETMLGILMGGSVVGFSYWVDRFLSPRGAVWGKLISVPIGFLAVYAIVKYQWGLFFFSIAVLIFVLALFFERSTGHVSEKNMWIKKQLDRCCS